MTRFNLLLLFLLALPTTSLRAQQDTCSYDACALRIKRGFWGRRLVQGREEQKVAGFALLAPSLDTVMQRSDSAARYYSLFRVRHNRGFWFALSGVALYGGATLVYGIDRDLEGPTIAMSIAGTAAFIVGLVNTVRAEEPLSRSVWWYNRSLATRP
jgi:hypothetical protein